MKKILMLVVSLMTTITFGQNLVVNGDFETWTDATTLTSFSPSPLEQSTNSNKYFRIILKKVET